MSAPVDSGDLGALSRDLCNACDAKIAQVVAVVDRLQERGDADRLIAPLRGRLAQLRPARPLRLSRLLFLPLDPLIASPARWRPDALTIPRSALTPLAATLRAVLPGQLVAGIDAMIAGHTTADTQVVARAGAMLWPAAGVLLLEPPPPKGWEASNLPHADYKPLAQAAGALLTQAVALHELREAARCGCKPDTVAGERMMQSMAAFGPVATGRMLTLVLASLPDAAALLRAAETRAGLTQAGGRAAADSAVAFFLERLEEGDPSASPLATCGLQGAGTTVHRVHMLLNDLAEGATSPERRRRIADIRQALDASCRARFANALEAEVLQPLQSADRILEDGAVVALEAAARSLRSLERAARRIGGGASYDGLLRRTVEEVGSGAAGRALEAVDRVRLVEILAGPEQALKLLEAARRSDGP